MADKDELHALQNISTEIDEARIKVIIATQCFKAQTLLLEKLKKQVQRNKEKYGAMSNDNKKLETEITLAEQQLTSMKEAKGTIRMANVELRKEWLKAKEKRTEIIERVQIGEKKYKEQGLVCKTRYESLPYVQKLLKAQETAHTLKVQISVLETQAVNLYKDIQRKKNSCQNLDKKRIIQLAEIMIIERPKLIQAINEKSVAILDLTKELKRLNIIAVEKEKKSEETKVKIDTVDQVSKDIKTDENAFILPKLQLPTDTLNLDDLMSVKHKQVKLKKKDYTPEKKEPFKNSNCGVSTDILNRKTDVEMSVASYFSKLPLYEEHTPQNYSKYKLINILKDVKIGYDDAMKIISEVNPDTLQPVENIYARNDTKTNEDTIVSINTGKEYQNEEIEMECSNANDIIMPPTQFLDSSSKTQNSLELKKSVSFNLTSVQRPELQHDAVTVDDTERIAPQDNDENEPITSQLDVSAVSDDEFTRTKYMVLKKHNLNLSPQFVYAKNTVLPMKSDEKVVTSKFFKGNDINDKTINDNVTDMQKDDNNEVHNLENKAKVAEDNWRKVIELEDDDVMVSSPKKQKIDREPSKSENSFTGYLFSRRHEGLPESQDVSINTTGYADGDVDFPHCLDSSLLLSPKADISDGNCENNSQKLPNFLSGFRKTGLSIFENSAAGDSKPGCSSTSKGSSGFNFNFGGNEKKNRGGLFSMFQ